VEPSTRCRSPSPPFLPFPPSSDGTLQSTKSVARAGVRRPPFFSPPSLSLPPPPFRCADDAGGRRRLRRRFFFPSPFFFFPLPPPRLHRASEPASICTFPPLPSSFPLHMSVHEGKYRRRYRRLLKRSPLFFFFLFPLFFFFSVYCEYRREVIRRVVGKLRDIFKIPSFFSPPRFFSSFFPPPSAVCGKMKQEYR